jgi:hypothetical protein
MAPEAPSRLTLLGTAEWLMLLSLLAAPWPFGGAPDPARYVLIGTTLAAGGLWTLSLLRAGKGLPHRLAWILLLPSVALLQVVLIRPLSIVTWAEALLVLTGNLTMFLFWSERSRDRVAGRRLAFVVLSVCAAEAIFGAVQWSESPGRIYGRMTPIVTSPFGSFVDHNHFAGLIEMGAVLALGATLGLLRREGLSPRFLAMGGLSFGLVMAQLASRSRGGFLSLLVGVAAIIIGFGLMAKEGRRRVRLLATAAALLLVIAMGLGTIPSPTLQHLSTVLWGGADTSAAYRVDVTRDTLRLAATHGILGVGLGNFPDAFPAVKRDHGDVRTTHAEDDIAEFLAETGGIGLLAAIGLAYGTVGGLKNRLETGTDPWRRGLALGSAGACIALLAHSFLDFNLRIPSNALVFSSLAGLAVSPRTETARFGRWSSGVATVVLLLAAALSFGRAEGARELGAAERLSDASLRIGAFDRTLTWHRYLADGFRERGVEWLALAGAAGEPLATERLARAQRDLARAVSLRPAWGEAWTDLGWAQYRSGHLEGAAQSLDRGALLDPTNLQVGVAKADFEARVVGASRGIDELVRLRHLNPDWGSEAALQVARRWTADPKLLAPLHQP